MEMPLLADSADHPHDFVRLRRVEPCEGLVEECETGPHGDGTGDLDEFPVGIGQAARDHIFHIGQAEQSETVKRFGFGVSASALPSVDRAYKHVLEDGHGRGDLDELEGPGNAPPGRSDAT